MINSTPIPFFTDDIAIVAHTTSSDMSDAIGKPMTIREFGERVNGPVYLGTTDNGELYAAAGRYPNIQFLQGPENIQAAA